MKQQKCSLIPIPHFHPKSPPSQGSWLILSYSHAFCSWPCGSSPVLDTHTQCLPTGSGCRTYLCKEQINTRKNSASSQAKSPFHPNILDGCVFSIDFPEKRLDKAKLAVCWIVCSTCLGCINSLTPTGLGEGGEELNYHYHDDSQVAGEDQEGLTGPGTCLKWSSEKAVSIPTLSPRD